MISTTLLGTGDEFEDCPVPFRVFHGIKAFLHLQFIKHILQPPFLVHFDRFDFGLNLCDKLILIIHVPGHQVKEGAQGASAAVIAGRGVKDHAVLAVVRGHQGIGKFPVFKTVARPAAAVVIKLAEKDDVGRESG